jgi:hypothetical protein
MSPATATSSSRRVLLQRGASAFAAFAATPTFANSDKGYLTMSEYQALKQQALKDERLYGLFEALRTRAAQTSEFTTLADKDDLTGVSKLALAWDSTIRQQTLDEASKQLTGADKDAGAALSKKVLEDLKQLDKLAKEGNKAEVAGATATLKVAAPAERATERATTLARIAVRSGSSLLSHRARARLGSPQSTAQMSSSSDEGRRRAP